MSEVRTRFAPSPTGRMHVGNLRTALYEYLIAKHEGGTFILRIEDTDQERLVEGAVDIIYRTIQGTGLIHDEGPDKDGGYGPYVQSERQASGIYLEYAKKLGATNIINAAETDVFAEIDKLTDKKGVDVVIETAGSARTISQTPYLVKNGGNIVLVGLAPQDIIEFNFAKIMAKEATIKSVFRYKNIYPIAIKAISKGIIDITGIVTHEFAFDDVEHAFDYVINNKQEVVKAVIKID